MRRIGSFAHSRLSAHRRWPAGLRRSRPPGRPGLDVPIGDPSRSDQEYVWISNASNLPLFVERVYPGLESARKALNVKVRIAGPTSVDLAAFITTVDAECTKNPAGVIVVGGWDDALASEVDKCIDKKVPTVVTDGDLPMSKRLTYLGTNWYNLGYQHGQYQCRYHADAGLKTGEIGTISFLAASNFIAARQGLRDALAKECPDVKVVADEESGTNVEQVAANTAAIIQGHPNLTGMVGFDSEAGPGIVRAVTEAGKAGKIIITSNEAGRDFLNSIKDGTVKMINMEKYETMDFFAVFYLYTFHNDIIRNLGMDHWLQNPLPAIGDSGLIFVTTDNVDTILAATDPDGIGGITAPTGLDVPIGDPSRSGPGVCLDQQRLEPAALRRAGLSGPRVGAQGAQRQGPHRRPDLGRPRRLHHHGRRRVHQEPGRRDRRRRLGRCARLRGRQVHRQEGPDGRHRRRPADVEAPHLSRHQLVQSRLPARPVSVPLPRGGGSQDGRDRHDLVPRRAATSSPARQGLRDALAKECPDVKVVADEESGTNVEQVAANTAAIIQGHPNLTGMVGFDSEAGPGIVRAVTEAGKAGKIIVTSNEAGRDFLNSIKDGTVKMINMEKYETMDFFAVFYLYTFHNDIIRNLGMDHWLQNPLPAIGDSGLIFVTKDNVDTILAATAPAE